MMIKVSDYIDRLAVVFPQLIDTEPWKITEKINSIVSEATAVSGHGFQIDGTIAIHRSAHVEKHAVIKGPAIIGAGCFIASHAYLRGGVFLDENVTIGPGCEVKTTIIFSNTTLAHFNFVGDSLLGSHVNLEAGAVIANHHNDRSEKEISIWVHGKCVPIGVQKFGALIGDSTKIGANAVLSPGTILRPNAVVKRLSLIEQCG
jgi:NDP-sugar pyrophosphorylase family protein